MTHPPTGTDHRSPDHATLWRTPDPVGEHLLLSGDLDPDPARAVRQLAEWSALGVTAIVDCRDEWSDEDFVAQQAPGLVYVNAGTHDNGGRQCDRWFDTGVGEARRVLDESGGRVMVHCHMGVNRGPSMGLAILLDEGWDVVDALDAIRAARPIAAIAYAEDAVRWHLRRQDETETMIAAQRRRVRAWHEANPIDAGWIIHRIRQAS